MSEEDTSPPNVGPRRDIHEVHRKVMELRGAYYYANSKGGSVSRADLEAAVVEYWDVLHEYTEEVEEMWEENGLDNIKKLARETTTVVESTDGYGQGTQTKTVPKLRTLSDWDLLEYTFELDRVRKELGFSASVAESTQRVQIDDELIEEVEEWRKQNLEA